MNKNITLLIVLLLFGQYSFCQKIEERASNDIVFQTGFEEGNKSIWDDYDGNPDTENQIIPDPGPFNTEGNHVVRLAVPSGVGGASDMVKVLPSEYDSLYVRWYIKYEEGFNFDARNHGGGLFAGQRNYLGQSDNRPNGDDFAISTVEYNTSLHTSQIYSYYRGMYMDCANPAGACWGDQFPCTSDEGETYCEKEQHRDPPVPPTLTAGKWYRIEMKFSLGTPSTDGSISDGEISLWVDSINYGTWDDLWIRTTSDVKLNILWLLLYHHDDTHSHAGILMDDVVVSTKLLGITGVQRKENTKSSIEIYPNPANSSVSLKLPKHREYSIMLYDMCGRMLVSESITGTEGTISIEGFEQGIYNMVVKDKTGNSVIASEKLVCR